MARSKIYYTDRVVNTERKFGAAEAYTYVLVIGDKTSRPAMFTDVEIERAIERAGKNKEDSPRKTNIFDGLLRWVGA
jgi:hypothetical protein